MHVFGKVLLWLSLLLVIGAVVLTTMLLDTRSRWLSQIEDRMGKLQTSADRLAQAEQTHRDLRDERQNLTSNWGEVWMAQNSGPQLGGTGGIEIGVGSGAGLGVTAQGQDRRPVFVFGVANAQQSAFLGEFQIVDQRADRTVAAMTRLPYPNEVEAWPGGVYRVRENLPPDWLARFSSLEDQYLVADSNLKAQQLLLENLTNQIRESQQALDRRLAELNGDPAAPEDSGQDLRLGLVETVRTAASARNDVSAVVDRQRRQLDRMYVQLRKTLSENQRIVDDLTRSVDSGAQTPPPQAQRSPAESDGSAR